MKTALVGFFFGFGMNEAMTNSNLSTRIHTKKLTWNENISHSSLITKQKEI